jgi:hypothetical protein
MSRFDAFHQILIIVEELFSETVLHVGKQVAVARSEIRAVRRVVKQFPVEMLQQWGQLYVDEHFHGGLLQWMSTINASFSE